MNLIVNPGRPGSPITGQQSDEDVARSAALGLWSCSKSRSNKIVRRNNHISILELIVELRFFFIVEGFAEDWSCPPAGQAAGY